MAILKVYIIPDTNKVISRGCHPEEANGVAATNEDFKKERLAVVELIRTELINSTDCCKYWSMYELEKIFKQVEEKL